MSFLLCNQGKYFYKTFGRTIHRQSLEYKYEGVVKRMKVLEREEEREKGENKKEKKES